jgi:hypothetical protein
MARRLKSTVVQTTETMAQRIAQGQQKAMIAQSRIAEHDAREERRMIELSRRAKSNMLTMQDLMGGLDSWQPPLSRADVTLPGMSGQRLTEEFPTQHDNILMEEMYAARQRKSQPAQPVQRQALREQVQQVKQSFVGRTVSGNHWVVKKFLGETRGGDTVPVWRVQNKMTGTAFDKLFRIEGVASRVAALLNESGDRSDPRIISLVSAYDKRDKLLKEARLLERSAEGKAMKTERLRAIRAEINQLDYRLGI